MKFLSTPSARRATTADRSLMFCQNYFYPRPPRGGRRGRKTVIPALADFYPRPPRGGRLSALRPDQHNDPYFYPRPPRGGRPAFFSASSFSIKISIHALREEGDEWPGCQAQAFPISIHALREEGDGKRVRHSQRRTISIHALREEGDPCPWSPAPWQADCYPRPPRGGRQRSQTVEQAHREISIHALREEGDRDLSRAA